MRIIIIIIIIIDPSRPLVKPRRVYDVFNVLLEQNRLQMVIFEGSIRKSIFQVARIRSVVFGLHLSWVGVGWGRGVVCSQRGLPRSGVGLVSNY